MVFGGGLNVRYWVGSELETSVPLKEETVINHGQVDLLQEIAN
jgi:hypothetical protein